MLGSATYRRFEESFKRKAGLYSDYSSKDVDGLKNCAEKNEEESTEESKKLNNKPAKTKGAVQHITAANRKSDQRQHFLELKKLVIHPDNMFRVYWDSIIMLLTVYYGFSVPYDIAFVSDDAVAPQVPRG